ncbi:unnamed protein product [Urochloa humidicola]
MATGLEPSSYYLYLVGVKVAGREIEDHPTGQHARQLGHRLRRSGGGGAARERAVHGDGERPRSVVLLPQPHRHQGRRQGNPGPPGCVRGGWRHRGTIIDSGTVISRLPPRAYAALRSAFVRSMGNFTRAPALSILDTCYNFTGHTRVRIPAVALAFAGGATLNLNARGVLSTVAQTCLGFASTGNETYVNFLGNTQQKTLTVIHDVARQRIGFGAKGCN